jgi:UDP-N-acetylglucosamine 2-epimerase (non-hydrolysing)
MKVGPVMAALAAHPSVVQSLVHTGQHYDANMSDVFFSQLRLPHPDVNLGVGSGSHAVQTAQVMMRLEEIFLHQRPDWVIVYGDVNSTVAAAIVCSKLLIPIAHVEAGLRSFDRTMPEEINRVLTDQISTLLFTPSSDADENLRREGIAEERIHLVGNVMIDTLIQLLPKATASWPALKAEQNLQDFVLVTLHRPSNVDDPEMLAAILNVLHEIAQEIPVFFPVHPRTLNRIHAQGLDKGLSGICFAPPLGYLDFLALQAHAKLVITDSGGIQEETTFLRVPCLTVRTTTERPITTTMGSNVLVGQDMSRLKRESLRILKHGGHTSLIPPLWDGHTGSRIAQVLTHG